MDELLYVISAVFVLYLLVVMVSTVFVGLYLVVRFFTRRWRNHGLGRLTED